MQSTASVTTEDLKQNGPQRRPGLQIVLDGYQITEHGNNSIPLENLLHTYSRDGYRLCREVQATGGLWSRLTGSLIR
jgi:hypothetical protein